MFYLFMYHLEGINTLVLESKNLMEAGKKKKKNGGDDTERLTSRYPIQAEMVGYTLGGSALRCRYLGRLWCLWLVVVVFVVGVRATSVTDHFGVRK